MMVLTREEGSKVHATHLKLASLPRGSTISSLQHMVSYDRHLAYWMPPPQFQQVQQLIERDGPGNWIRG